MENLPETESIVLWVWLNLSEDVASNFMYTLILEEPIAEPSSYFSYKCRAHSVDSPFDIIRSSGPCGFFPYDQLIPFCKRQATCQNGKTYEYNWEMVAEVESRID